jgi:hypothetical protein
MAITTARFYRSCVVLLMRGGDEPITFDDAEAGAVMVADEKVSWSELAAVVYGLVLEGRETESGRGPTDLFALADSLADAIGGAVVIHDGLLRVLAYSQLQRHADPARVETILARQTPEHLVRSGCARLVSGLVCGTGFQHRRGRSRRSRGAHRVGSRPHRAP